MLREIHWSKTSFSEFVDTDNPLQSKYHQFDTIVLQEVRADKIGEMTIPIEYDETLITIDDIEEAKKKRAARIHLGNVEKYLAENPDGVKKDVPKTVAADISVDDLVFRIISYEHIPAAPGRKNKPKSVADTKIKVNFMPFKHYTLVDGKLNYVGRSHCKDGKFTLTSGHITNKLAEMFVLLVNRYSQRSNWRGYSYVDEMRGQALLQLSSMGLQFNEHKSANPFAYYTQVLSNAFTRIFNTEKNHQNIRDDLLERNGQTASFSRQLAIEEEMRRLREAHDTVPGTGD